MFGRRRRAREFEAIREALAADAASRFALVDALQQMDARLTRSLEEHARTQAATDATVQHLRATSVETRSGLTRAVDELGRFCEVLGDRIDAERSERQIFLTAMQELAGRSTIELAPEPPRERVLGGSFDAEPPTDVNVTVDVDEPRSLWG